MITPPFDELAGWLFKVTLAGAMSFLWWGKKKEKELLDDHTKKIIELKSTAVTEDKVREIVTEVTANAMTPMMESISEIKHLVTDNTSITKGMQLKMAEQEGYQKALKELSDS